jgi:hypothetical protein
MEELIWTPLFSVHIKYSLHNATLYSKGCKIATWVYDTAEMKQFTFN